ncbi:MAG: RrF2 family transcriptional regulator [Mangrovibacterium sp.]
MLSKTCKYALRAIIYIAKNSADGKKIRIKSITEEIDVPAHFLAKILQNLVKDGVIQSTKGPSGGFYIDRPLAEIPLSEVVEVIEGKEYLNHCLLKNEPCDCQQSEGAKLCPLHEHFSEVRQEVKRFYQETTIQSVLESMELHGESIAL